jgi:hypothetical protein
VQAKKVKKHGTPEENKEGPISSWRLEQALSLTLQSS